MPSSHDYIKDKRNKKGYNYRVNMTITFDETYFDTRKEFSVGGERIAMNFKTGLKTDQKFFSVSEKPLTSYISNIGSNFMKNILLDFW